MSQAADHQLLLNELSQDPTHTLWLADENALPLLAAAPAALTLLTNRWDIWAQAHPIANRIFSDWDLSQLTQPERIRRVVYQVSKEKAVVAHLINQIAERLSPGTELVLLGRKNEGIKSLASLAGMRLQGGKPKKAGNLYLCRLLVPDETLPAIDDQQYTQLRPSLDFQGQTLRSKPGTFGWQKLDEGSLLLLSTLADHASTFTPDSVLDLGCGYGLLTVGAQALFPQPAIQWLATDNCAAALTCASANTRSGTKVFAGDRGLDASGQPPEAPVDLIICNPPFHQGFEASGDLTDRFLQAMHLWLKPGGRLLLVVNRFVGIEQRLAGRFRRCDTLADNGSFRVLLLSEKV